MSQQSSRLATAAATLGALAVVVGAGGVLGATLGVLAPMQGFGAFALGGLLGVVSVIVSGFALRATRAGSGRSGRGRAWLGLVLGGVMLATLLRGASAGAGLPRINDITTDPDDPPQFEYAKRDPATRERSYDYPAGFAEQQRAAYPDLAPITLAAPPDAAFEAAQQAAAELGFEVTLSDEARGVIEARDTSRCSASSTTSRSASALPTAAARSSTSARSRATAAATSAPTRSASAPSPARSSPEWEAASLGR